MAEINEWMTEIHLSDGLPTGKQTITKTGNRFTIIVDKTEYTHPNMRVAWNVYHGERVVAAGIAAKKMLAWPIAEACADELESSLCAIEARA